MRIIILCMCFISFVSSANWTSDDKKTATETVDILTFNDEVMNGYLWLPDNYDANNQYPAVVMAHGCGGAHYKDAPEQWTAKYVSGKYKVWGKLLNDNGFIVLLVDSFTHRDSNGDVGGGVCGGDPLDRPAKIDPVTVRPADLAAGISFLKSRDDILTDKVGVMGFSNGGTSALVLANHQMLEANQQTLWDDGKAWFEVPFSDNVAASAIVSMYPGCGLNGYSEASQDVFDNAFDSYTETYIYAASNDNSLPDDTLEKCHNLRVLDAQHDATNSALQLNVVANTDHQFDYKEEDELQVQKTLARILAIFTTM